MSLLCVVSVSACTVERTGGPRGDKQDGTSIPTVTQEALRRAKPGDYTFIPDPGIACLNGTGRHGFAFSPSPDPDSTELMVYFVPGGADFNPFSGLIYQSFGNRSFTADTLANRLSQKDSEAGTLGSGLTARNPSHPLTKSYHIAVVGNCSGDVFAGSQSLPVFSQDGELHRGRHNVQRVLAAVAGHFSRKGIPITKVLGVGSSAGALGLMANVGPLSDTFSGAHRAYLFDSALPFTDEYMTPCIQVQMHEAWDLSAFVSASRCANCTVPSCERGGLFEAMLAMLEGDSSAQMLLLSSREDKIMRAFFAAANPWRTATTTQAQACGLDPASSATEPSSDTKAGQKVTWAPSQCTTKATSAAGYALAVDDAVKLMAQRLGPRFKSVLIEGDDHVFVGGKLEKYGRVANAIAGWLPLAGR